MLYDLSNKSTRNDVVEFGLDEADTGIMLAEQSEFENSLS